MRRFLIILSTLVFIAGGIGCTRYQRQVTSFKLPEGYSNFREIGAAKIAAYSYKTRKEAKKAFGFDIWGSGLMPIQVVVDNQGSDTFEIQPSNTFLVDNDNNVWPVLDSELAYQRLSSKTDLANIAAGSVKPAILGAAVGTVVGAAVGIVTGENVAETAGKGAAVGAAAGAVLGGAGEIASKTAEQQISEDLYSKGLENKAITPGDLTYGFIFFPGEAKTAKVLRLKLKETTTGEIYFLHLEL